MPESLVYLIVDGHSVIFAWPRLRSLHQKKTALARQQLTEQLQRLHDISDWRVTIVFDGRHGLVPVRKSEHDLVVAYSSQEETADSVIERLVSASGKSGRILVVTADEAERRTVEAMGAETASPEWLASELETRAIGFEEELQKVKKRAKW